MVFRNRISPAIFARRFSSAFYILTLLTVYKETYTNQYGLYKTVLAATLILSEVKALILL